jgi:3-oxocholest-4-en-26-oate---CoA ligase
MPLNHFADAFDAVAQAIDPAEPALIHDDDILSWGEFDQRTNALARHMLAAGLQPGDKVAHLMRNGLAYPLTTVAAMKARLVHVNVNFRYSGEELYYIIDNSDAAAIVYDAEFASEISALRSRLEKVSLFIEVADGGSANPFATPFSDAIQGDGGPLDLDRSADDLIFIYTGGTTGAPKGVMWRQADMWAALGGGAPIPGMPAVTDAAALQENVRQGLGKQRFLACPPLMHGAGLMMTLATLAKGGTLVTIGGRSFSAQEALNQISSKKVNAAVLVGDAFGRPLLKELDANASAYDLSSLMILISSGMMWSPEVKEGLLRHQPKLMMMDALGASEGLGHGRAVSGAGVKAESAKFMAGPETKVLDPDTFEEIPRGSGRAGLIATPGPIPLGYYKDPAKTDRTFRIIDGVRYSIPGDHGMIEADGALKLMGRGSQCINTGGEKVFPEEVEETLKTHPTVDDALVVGVPDEKWGQAVTAVVEVNGQISQSDLQQHVRRQLAGYKTPKRIIFVAKVPRGPNGKADYAAARNLALAGLAESVAV